MLTEFSAQPGCTTVLRSSPVFSVEKVLKCLVHLHFMQDGVVERSVWIMYHIWIYLYVTACVPVAEKDCFLPLSVICDHDFQIAIR